jgi:hypothetical protein
LARLSRNAFFVAESRLASQHALAMSAPLSTVHEPGPTPPLEAFTADITRTRLSPFYSVGLVSEHLADIQARLGTVPYPFAHPRGQLTVAEYARQEQPCQHEWEAIFRAGSAHVERLFPLHYRLLGRLLVLAQAWEKETGPESGHPLVILSGSA